MDQKPAVPSRSPGSSGNGVTKDQSPSIEFRGSHPRRMSREASRHYPYNRLYYYYRGRKH